MAHAGNRLGRFKDSVRGAEITLPGCLRSRRTIPQRFPSPVALQTSMAVPTTESYTQSPRPLESSQRSLHPDRYEMEQSILATRCSSTTIATSDSRSSSSTYRYEDGHAPTSRSRIATVDIADFGWQNMLTEWTTQEQALLMSSWRGSTINTYRPGWNRWINWCEIHLINYEYPNADKVACLLLSSFAL